jgi:peptidyl-prolyl cis-trans isomerase D
MLQSLRKGAGSWLAKGLMFLLIASFGLWGVADYMNVFQAPPVAVVGDVTITGPDYQTAVRQSVQRLQQQFGPQFDMEQAKRLGIPDSTLNGLLERSMLDQEASRLGLRAPDSAVREEILSAPMFRNSLGQFDRLAFENAIRNQGYGEQQFIGVMRGDMLRAQLFEALTGGADPAPGVLVDALNAYRQERRVVDLVELKDTDAPAPAAPDEAALAAFHKENTARFSSPEMRELAWITVSPVDLAKDQSVSDAEIREEYEARAASYTRPETRTVEQAVFRTEADALAARAQIDAGKDFVAVTTEALKLKPSDLSLGKVSKAQMLPATATPAFELPLNKVSDPVRSPVGWHLLRVTAIEPGSTKTLAEASDEIRGYVAERKAADQIVRLGQQVDDKLASGATLEETAQAFSLTLNKAVVDARGRDAKGTAVVLPAIPRFLPNAFQSAERNDPLVEDSGNGGFYLLRVERIVPPALRPLDEVRTDVAAAWSAAQRAKAIEQRGAEFAEKVRAGGDLQALAQAAKSKVELSTPFTRQGEGADARLSGRLIADLFRGKPGDVVTGRSGRDDGAVIARLVRIEPAQKQENDRVRDAVAQSLAGGVAEDIYATYKNQLERRYSPSVNRVEADRAL